MTKPTNHPPHSCGRRAARAEFLNQSINCKKKALRFHRGNRELCRILRCDISEACRELARLQPRPEQAPKRKRRQRRRLRRCQQHRGFDGNARREAQRNHLNLAINCKKEALRIHRDNPELCRLIRRDLREVRRELSLLEPRPAQTPQIGQIRRSQRRRQHRQQHRGPDDDADGDGSGESDPSHIISPIIPARFGDWITSAVESPSISILDIFDELRAAGHSAEAINAAYIEARDKAAAQALARCSAPTPTTAEDCPDPEAVEVESRGSLHPTKEQATERPNSRSWFEATRPTRQERFRQTPKCKLYRELLRRFRFYALQHRPLKDDGDPAAYDRACHRFACWLYQRRGVPLKPRQLQRMIDGASDLAAISPARYHRNQCRKGGRNSGQSRRDLRAPKVAEALELAASGQSCRQIAERLKVGKSTVNRWIQAAREKPQPQVSHELVSTAYKGEPREKIGASATASRDTPQMLVGNLYRDTAIHFSDGHTISYWLPWPIRKDPSAGDVSKWSRSLSDRQIEAVIEDIINLPTPQTPQPSVEVTPEPPPDLRAVEQITLFDDPEALNDLEWRFCNERGFSERARSG